MTFLKSLIFVTRFSWHLSCVVSVDESSEQSLNKDQLYLMEIWNLPRFHYVLLGFIDWNLLLGLTLYLFVCCICSHCSFWVGACEQWCFKFISVFSYLLQGMQITYFVTVDDVECAYFDQVEKLQNFGSQNGESIAQLVWAFFHYWAYCHDYANDVISVRTGSTLRWETLAWRMC